MEKKEVNIEVLRASEEWQRAGAYSVRIEGMNRQYGIPLHEEFDEHDGPQSKYIVLLDEGYPVATCRFYGTAPDTAMIGRVVVLPQYRGCGLGRRVICEAEQWIQELGYRAVRIDSRTTATGFYKKLGYRELDGIVQKSGFFECVSMAKTLF